MFRLSSPLNHSVILLAFSMIAGCTSTPSMNSHDRELYLNSFVGQSSEYIYNHLDLSKMGYEQSQPPELSPSALSYHIERKLFIPMSVPQSSAGGTGTVPIPIANSRADGYDTSLSCQIVFPLKDNIAQSVSYTGRTC
ncbi:hypothetical protein A3K93_01395 [Acinetobacter sp. NCu2D-2]|uniref:hypothetical protein n=1 Tax=Acinetobacter sp. NCu2D-2 TaxID=1608473 RepID=UPI0007CE0582|nr:hypothetical protein [Acinetobacter sp. NCu2D-2]ANF80971.1 hypothetical protein A3K93_01395 [Acinetobacter sp. NCu2D-2]